MELEICLFFKFVDIPSACIYLCFCMHAHLCVNSMYAVPAKAIKWHGIPRREFSKC